MSRKRFRAAFATVVALVASGLVASTPARAADFTAARVTLVVGQQASVYSQESGDQFALLAGAGSRGVSWSRGDGSEAWSISLQAPANGVLTTGSYYNASGGIGHRPEFPELRLAHNSVSCSETGFFIVSKAELNADASFKTLDMTFEQKCSDTGAATVYGRIQLNVPLQTVEDPSGPAVLFSTRPGSLPDAGIVWAFTSGTADIASLRARIISPATGLQVALASFNKVSSNPQGLMAWYAWVDNDVHEPGIYRIDTEITRTGGGTIAQTDTGNLMFDIQTTILDFDAGKLTYDNPTTATATGSLAQTNPWTHVGTPLAGATVKLFVSNGGQLSFVTSGLTDGSGHFSIPVSTQAPLGLLALYEGDSNGTVRRAAPLADGIDILKSPVNFTVNPMQFALRTTALSGKATFLTQGQWVPLASTPIEIWDAYGGEQQLAETVLTDAQGNYSVTHTARFWPSGQVWLVVKPASIFIAETTAVIYLAPDYPGVVIDAFVGYWVGDGIAEFAARVTIPGTPPPNLAFALQFQTPGGWQTMGWGAPTRVPEWGPDAWLVTVQAPVPCGATSYWRLAYGLAYPDHAAYSQSLSAFRVCRAPRRQVGTRVPVPRR
jgi:hypothetical protein